MSSVCVKTVFHELFLPCSNFTSYKVCHALPIFYLFSLCFYLFTVPLSQSCFILVHTGKASARTHIEMTLIHGLAIQFLHDSIHVRIPILPNHPTLSLSLWVQKSGIHICVFFPVLHTGSSLPSMGWDHCRLISFFFSSNFSYYFLRSYLLLNNSLCVL